MIRKKFVCIIFVLILLLISSLKTNFNTIDFEYDSKFQHLNKNDDGDVNVVDDKDALYCNSRGIQGNTRPIDSKARGGSWVDTFEDVSGIDQGSSDHFEIKNENAKINTSYYSDKYSVALWQFEENTGTITYDESINSNDGILGGDGSGTDLPTWTAGRIGYGLSFDGVDDFVSFENDDSLNLSTSDFTIEAWVKISKTGALQQIVRKGHATAQAGNGRFSLTIASTNKVRIVLEDQSTSVKVFTGNKVVTDNVWHHICAVFDRNDKATIYIDGIYDSSTSISSYSGSVDCDIICYIGGNPVVTAVYIGGKVDQVSITKVARTAQEVKDIYENSSYSYINNNNGNLTSKPIQLPKDMHWDKLRIDKTEYLSTLIYVSIFNATNNQPITGTPIYTIGGEFDISNIDSKKYPAIKLYATMEGNDRGLSPLLHFWGVSWNASNCWQDTLFGGSKFESSTNVDFIDDEAQFQNAGSLRSSTIDIPDKCYYNTLKINKTEPSGGLFKVSLLDAQTNSEITGFKDLTGTELDISGLHSDIYSSIKLRADYTTSGQKGILHDWSLNWTKNVKPKILNVSSVQTVNRTSIAIIALNLTDPNEAENDLTLNGKYKSPTDTTWKTEYLGTPIYSNNRWEIPFTPPANAKVGLYLIMFTCEDYFQYQDIYSPFYINVINNAPSILNVTVPSNIINRTKTLNIQIEPYDVETALGNLALDLTYKSEFDVTWKTNYISNIVFQSDNWMATFTPTKNAGLGIYTLNITCNDTLDDNYKLIQIQVINNKPNKPEVVITPELPKTTDGLTVLVSKGMDIETASSQIEFWYRWYKDDVYLQFFDNVTGVLSDQISKGETWNCIVYPFDGDDLGDPGAAEVTIQNSPPEVAEPFKNYILYEDSSVVLQNKLNEIFYDVDYDELTFSIMNQNRINVKFFQENGTIFITPENNWFGTEVITLYATDGEMESANEIVEITVIPSNDLPKITMVGSQIVTDISSKLEFVVKEDDWLNLSIQVDDIDGDDDRGMIQYTMNITERTNLFVQPENQQLVFKPTNDDVGVHYLTVSVTDNNETPPIYISQDLKITVLNTNDPPVVSIETPANGQIFKDVKNISFGCVAEDMDLSIPDSTETLSYKWLTNRTVNNVIGFEREITLSNEMMLKPGLYTITVEVTDRAGAKASDSIQIGIVKTEKEEPSGGFLQGNYVMIGLIAIMIIIFLIIVLFLVTFRKKRELEAVSELPTEPVLHPVSSYRTETTATISPELPATQTQILSPALSSLPAPQQTVEGAGTIPQSQAQLPPAQPPTQVTTSTQTPASSEKPEMTKEERLKLLGDRLIRGEISEETYLNLKDKIEFDAKAYETAPSLPPAEATVPSTIQSAPPTEPEQVQPQYTSAQQSEPKSDDEEE